ncbi:LYR motif-containing protein 4 isoform X2 [Ascaphus truei]|uniref:LYR motif-containing protein 4 isoform X2 n=1 Tax=Ascaphus truei TaxID=8439 RepID=UPI003F5926B5
MHLAEHKEREREGTLTQHLPDMIPTSQLLTVSGIVFARVISAAGPVGVLKMTASSRVQVLTLYKAMLRESQKFSAYNYRTYAIRRTRDAFRDKKCVDDFPEIQTLVQHAKENLDMIRRQNLGQLLPREHGVCKEKVCD